MLCEFGEVRKEKKEVRNEVPTIFSDKALKEKFDISQTWKKMVYGRYIDLHEIKQNGREILYYIKKKKLDWVL